MLFGGHGLCDVMTPKASAPSPPLITDVMAGFQCVSFPRMFVDSASKPTITVCGTQTKVTVFLRNECQGYSSYQQDIGTCDTKAASTTCTTMGPSNQEWLGHAQSYQITQCATGTQR